MDRERYMQVCVCGLCDNCKGKRQCPAYRIAMNAWDAAVIDTNKKACEVYENELREIVRVVNVLRKGVGDCISIEGSVKDFSKKLKGYVTNSK